MPDIFLSYSREDQVRARSFAEAFGRDGLDVWWDQTLRSGEAYDEVTEKALRSARAVVVLWSRTSVASRWVRAEATLADRQHTLVPAMIEACERPIMFELTHTADLSRWSGDSGDAGWRTFLQDVRRFVSSGAVGEVEPKPAVVPARPSGDWRPSIAILPFTNRSGDPTDDVFADGMEEDLLAALSLSSELRTIARSATLGYRRNARDVRTIGGELGVRYLLEGNVRRTGGSLRVTAQLIDAASAAILWSQRFDRPLTELAELQEDLVLEVAAHLNVQVERAEAERALRKPGDLTAWEAVMRSRSIFSQELGGHEILRAIEEARRAVAIEPDYATAHAALAHMSAHYFMSTGGRDRTLAEEARTHADRALKLDPGDATVLASVAIAFGYSGDWPRAAIYANRSLQINANTTFGQLASAMACINQTRPDEAIVHLRKARALAPLGALSFVTVSLEGIAQYQAGRFEAALDAIETGLLRNPMFAYGLKDRATCLSRMGRCEEAAQAIRRLRSANPEMTLQRLQSMNAGSFIAPATAADMNAMLGAAWETADSTASGA